MRATGTLSVGREPGAPRGARVAGRSATAAFAWTCLTGVLLTVVLCGCLQKTYGITLVPEGEELQRKLSPGFPEDALGWSCYRRLTSNVGMLSVYAERFGAVHDPAKEFSEVRTVAAKAGSLLAGWFETELGAEAGFDKLREFCTKELPRDLENVAFNMLLVESLPHAAEEAEEEAGVRTLQYLCERGYFEVEQVPAIVRAAEEGDAQKLLALAQRFVADKMGIPKDQEPLPSCLGFLSTPERARASLEAYIRSAEEFRECVRQWEIARQARPDQEEPGLLEFACGSVIDSCLHIELFPDRLRVRLACSVEPFSTNGQWDGVTNYVVWEGTPGSKTSAGQFCYAFWSVPDTAFQARHFGKAVLQGQELAEYIVWRCGLSEEEGRQWDEFVSGLEPGEGLGERIDSFVFPAAPGVALEMRTLLRECLKRGADEGVGAAPTQPEASADHGGATAGVPTPKP